MTLHERINQKLKDQRAKKFRIVGKTNIYGYNLCSHS